MRVPFLALAAAILAALAPAAALASQWGSAYGDPDGFCPEQSFLPGTYASIVTNDPSVGVNPERDTFWGVHTDPGYDDWYGRWYGDFEGVPGDDSGWRYIATVPYGSVSHWNFADYGWQVHGHVKQYIAYYNWTFGGSCGLGFYGGDAPAPYMADVYGNPVVDFWVDSTPPFPPAPRVTSVTASTVSFAWDAVADRGDGSGQDYFAVGVDHYDWSVQTGSTILQQGSSPDPVPLTAGGLAPAQDACVHVRAVDRLGNATGDQVVCGRTAAAATPPPLPPPPASGTVRVNPSPIGLTGLDAWLWLEPAPQQTVISWSQSGFTYTETETPVVVRWNFGDGAGATIAAPAGFGLAYPAQSTVTHRYERQAQGGYAISATVDYSIDWSASAGSVTSGVAHLGTVSSTTPALQYPVAQAQPELVSGG